LPETGVVATTSILSGFNYFDAKLDRQLQATIDAAIRAVPKNIPGGRHLNQWEETFAAPIGDEIDITNRLKVIVGANLGIIDIKNFSTSVFFLNEPTFHNYYVKVTPGGSVDYRLYDWLSLYAGYMQGISNGGVAFSPHLGLPVSNLGA